MNIFILYVSILMAPFHVEKVPAPWTYAPEFGDKITWNGKKGIVADVDHEKSRYRVKFVEGGDSGWLDKVQFSSGLKTYVSRAMHFEPFGFGITPLEGHPLRSKRITNQYGEKLLYYVFDLDLTGDKFPFPTMIGCYVQKPWQDKIKVDQIHFRHKGGKQDFAEGQVQCGNPTPVRHISMVRNETYDFKSGKTVDVGRQHLELYVFLIDKDLPDDPSECFRVFFWAIVESEHRTVERW